MKTLADMVRNFELVKIQKKLLEACKKIRLTEEEAKIINKILEAVYNEGHNDGYKEGWQDAQELAWEEHGILLV